MTGTSGFIGTSLCERLAARTGFDVVGVDRRPPPECFPSIVYVDGDLTDTRFVRRLVQDAEPDAIVHLAAQARVDPSLLAAAPTYADNVTTTLNLIAALEGLSRQSCRFVYASSETVYGQTSRLPSTEDSPLNPQSPYAASKAACELLVTRALPRTALILRSGMGFGPRSDPSAQVVGRFISRALDNRPILFPKEDPRLGHPTRDTNFVGNFLDGLELALRAGATGTYNIASGREVSILDLAKSVIQATGTGAILRSDEFQYRAGEAGVRTWLDVSKGHDAFGYSPKVSLEDGLRPTVEWYRLHRDYFHKTQEPGPIATTQ